MKFINQLAKMICRDILVQLWFKIMSSYIIIKSSIISQIYGSNYENKFIFFKISHFIYKIFWVILDFFRQF